MTFLWKGPDQKVLIEEERVLTISAEKDLSIALVTDLDFNGKLLVVYNAHLESRSMGFIQMAQVDEMLADLKKYSAGTPVILGGDLNSKYFPSIFLRKLESEGFHSALGGQIERTHVQQSSPNMARLAKLSNFPNIANIPIIPSANHVPAPKKTLV